MILLRGLALPVQRIGCVMCHFQRASSFHQPKRKPRKHKKRELVEDTVFQYADDKIKRTEQVYVWGYAATGALGNKEMLVPRSPSQRPRKHQLYPHYLRTFWEQDKEVTHVACGYGFTVFGVKGSRNKRVLYGTGINTDSQIGFHCSKRDKPFQYVIAPLPIAIPLIQPDVTKYTHVACGRAHTVVVTDAEGMFSLGNNANGQCCRPVIEDEIYGGSQLIHKISFDKEVKQVVCGQDHTLILTADGEVYSCGLGADGQTGLGHFESTGKLTKVKGDIEGVRIAQLSSKGDCVLAVSEEGEVFGWGNSEYQQLDCVAAGHSQVSSPLHLPFTASVGKVKQVAAGGSTCALLNEEGDVYVWGYGILGKGPNVSSSPVPTKIPEILFGKNPFNKDIQVDGIVAGMNYFLAKTNYGDLYSWGRNKTAALGLGHIKDQFFPLKVHLAAEVNEIFCGVDHTVVKCRSF